MNIFWRWSLFTLGLLGFLALTAFLLKDVSPPDDVRVVDGYEPWDDKILELAESLPVQEGGRVKPLITYANFSMLRFFGARSMEIKAKESDEPIKIKPMAWMMDALFRPDYSVQQPSFRIEDSAIIEAIGIEAREKRDRYSYEELEPGLDRLMELAISYSKLDAKKRNPQEKQTIALAYNIRDYQQLIGAFALARNGVIMMPAEGTELEEPKQVEISLLMQYAPVFQQALREAMRAGQPIPPHVQDLFNQILAGSNESKHGIFVFPPSDPEAENWLSPGNRVMEVMTLETDDQEGAVADVKQLEKLTKSVGDRGEFITALTEFKDGVVERAEARGDYEQVPLEADYYQKDWFLYALIYFLLGLLCTIGMWMTSQTIWPSRILSWGVWLSTLAGLVYVIIPIVKRTIIMDRPPVGNLYDTFIFIAASSIIFGAIVELLTRKKFALGLLPIIGVLLITASRIFEVDDAQDHMDPLVAVLRSNYWLTVHVITITIAYAGGLITSLLSIVYILMRGLRLDSDKSKLRALTRAVYGMIAVTLCLSLVGTALGGIWANDSWGRFWGWDPKENGALMIVLTCLAILHARVGGYIREWGLHLASISMAAVITFSWWHVNMLETGLHSYGFSSSLGMFVKFMYASVFFFLLVGAACFAYEKIEKAQKSSKSEDSIESQPSEA